MAVLRYFHQDPRQTSVQESSVIDKQGTVLTQKLTTINQSITNNTQVLEDKLNSIPGKSLSTNDFTDEYKNKLRGIEEGAEVNVQSDWGEDDDTADSYIKNKPIIDDIVTQNSENLITSGAVFTAIDELPEPMIFKGSLGTGGTIQTLPAPSADNVGFVYKVITAGTYYGITAKPGDSFISDGLDWILIPSGDEPEGTVMSVGLSVPTGLKVSGSPITTSGTLAITYALGYAIPTTAKQDEWDAKLDAISDLSTIRSNASHGETAYGWGNHALAGYQPAISDLSTIRSNASEGHTAYGWGDHAKAGYVKSSGVTSVAMTVPTGLAISGSPITSTGTLALSFANGYSIPTTAKLSNWDTAYGWGNHASAGYVKSSGVTKISTTDGVVGGDITTTGTIKANLASYTKNTSDIAGRLYAVQLDKSGRLAVDVPWINTWKAANSSQEGYVPKSTANKILRANGDGALYWGDDANTWTAWKGATSSANGTAGYMPAPTKDQYHLFLRGDGTWVSLNNYSLPLAASGTRGGVLIGFTTDAANRNYAVLLSGEKMYVNVPWTDNNTKYSIATGDNNGQIKVTPSSGNAYNVSVKGLGSRAYDSTSYLPLAGGTMVAGSMINWADWGQFGKSDATYPKAQGGLRWAGTSDWIQLSAEEVARDDFRLILAFGDDISPSLDIRNNSGTTTMRLLSSGEINAESFVKSGGTSSLFLKADGSVDSNSYITGITKTMVTTALGYTPPTTDTNTWRGITDSYSGTDSSISLSQKGGNSLYNALVNGYASSAGNADTVDGYHASSLVHNASALNVFTDEAGWEIIPVSGSNVDGNFSSSKWGSCILWANNPGQKPSVVNTSNWYNQLFGLTDDRLYFRTRTNGGNWTSLKTIAYTSEIPTNLNQLTNGPGYITGITKTMVTNALGYTPPTADTNNAVALINTTTDTFYRLLFSGTADDTNRTERAGKNTQLLVNPNFGAIHAKGFFPTSVNHYDDVWTDSYNKNHPWYGIDFRAESGLNYFHSVYSDYFGMCFRTCFIKIAVGDYSAGAAELARTIYINNARDTNPIIFSVAGTISAENKLLAPNTHTTHIDGRSTDEEGPGPLYILCDQDEPVVIASGSPIVGIGKNPTLGKVDINGVCHASQFMPNSDLRLKDILSNMSINLKDVAEAPIFLFKWKDKNIDNLVHVGTSAQYWKEKVPELVSEANDDIKTLSLDYSALSVASNVTLAKEVVSLKEEIKLLQALIAELKLLLNN